MRQVRKIYDSITVISTPPKNLKAGEDLIFGNPAFTYTTPESYLIYVRKALVTDNGIIIKGWKPLDRFINCYKEDFRHYAKRYTLKVLLKSKKQKTDPKKNYLLIFDNYSGPRGFFHWIADGLTRLVELKDILSQYTVLVPAYFMKEALYQDTLCFFEIKDILVIEPDCCVQVENLYVADYIAPSGYFHPQNVLKLRDFIWEQCRVNKFAPGFSKIYISRKKATRRYVENEDEVVHLVEKYGFATVYLEDYSFRDQVKLVYQADYLVTIHGAALTHTCFMRPGTRVMEFRKKDDAHNNLYFSLASEAGVHYYYQLCEAKQVSESANNFNLVVDIDLLEKNIQFMLS